MTRRPQINATRTNQLNEKLQKAGRLFEAGKLSDAKQRYREVLKHDTCNVDLLQILGLIDNELGNYKDAETYFRRALLAHPKRGSVYISIGQFYLDQNRPEDALKTLQNAYRIDNTNPEICCLMGDVYKRLDLLETAIQWYLRSIRLKPDFTLAYTKLGSSYRTLNMLNKAFRCYQKVISINPNDPKALHNLGNIFIKIGSIDDAINYYHKALIQAPEYAEIHDSLGSAFQRKRDFESAQKSYLNAFKINPNNYLVNYHIGVNLKEQGKISESKQWLNKALELNPEFQPAKIHYLISLPIIYSRNDEIDSYRLEYSRGIDTLISDWEVSKSKDPRLHLSGLKGWTNFNLPYQGKNDLILQKKIGGYLHSVMKENFPDKSTIRSKILRNPRNKIRVGYVSENMYSHTVGKLFIGWIEKTDPSTFDIYCYHTNNRTDQITERYKTACFKFCNNIDGIEGIADQILSDDIDILVYLDIGMNALSQMLSALRLAPVQCVTWGHPVTTGLPTMDYFLSSDLMEPADGQNHYSETLTRLPNLSIYYNKPAIPDSIKKRDEFGLAAEDFVYLASQSLFKYLPEDDFIYSNIALSVPRSKFVFLEHESRHVTTLFQERLKNEFQKAGLDYEAFCIFQPRLSYPDFLNLNIISDVLLDPPAWSGGMTSLEGISCGLPTVTLPGELMRSRHTYAILTAANIQNTVANSPEDYIRIAVKLATDADFYEMCRTEIVNSSHHIYQDQQAIDGLERFYKSLVHTAD